MHRRAVPHTMGRRGLAGEGPPSRREEAAVTGERGGEGLGCPGDVLRAEQGGAGLRALRGSSCGFGSRDHKALLIRGLQMLVQFRGACRAGGPEMAEDRLLWATLKAIGC